MKGEENERNFHSPPDSLNLQNVKCNISRESIVHFKGKQKFYTCVPIGFINQEIIKEETKEIPLYD